MLWWLDGFFFWLTEFAFSLERATQMNRRQEKIIQISPIIRLFLTGRAKNAQKLTQNNNSEVIPKAAKKDRRLPEETHLLLPPFQACFFMLFLPFETQRLKGAAIFSQPNEKAQEMSCSLKMETLEYEQLPSRYPDDSSSDVLSLFSIETWTETSSMCCKALDESFGISKSSSRFVSSSRRCLTRAPRP